MLLYYFVNNQFKAFSINLNVQHVNGMTPFDVKLGQASIFLGQDFKKVGSGQQNGTWKPSLYPSLHKKG